MSRKKAAAILSLSDVDRCIRRAKRDARIPWQRLSDDEWVEFCGKMAGWFANQAPDEYDLYVKENNARKAASDKTALEKKTKARQAQG